jgi:hypothetical protein
MEAKYSLPHSQQPAKCPYPSHNNPVCAFSFSFLKAYFSIILPLMPCSSKQSLSLSCFNKPRYGLLPHSCHMSRPSHPCSTNHNTPQFAVPSAPYSPTPSAYVLRLVCKTDCSFHITPQDTCQFCDFKVLPTHSFYPLMCFPRYCELRPISKPHTQSKAD